MAVTVGVHVWDLFHLDRSEFKPILAPQGQITGCLATGVATECLATQRPDNRMFDLGHGYQVF